MTLREKVMGMFANSNRLIREMNRTECQSADYLKLQEEYKKINTELQLILAESLFSGEYSFKDITIGKEYFKTRAHNGVLSIPFTLDYREIGLSAFARKPGNKQIEHRRREVLSLITPAGLMKMRTFHVGTSYFEVHTGKGVVFVNPIEIVA